MSKRSSGIPEPHVPIDNRVILDSVKGLSESIDGIQGAVEKMGTKMDGVLKRSQPSADAIATELVDQTIPLLDAAIDDVYAPDGLFALLRRANGRVLVWVFLDILCLAGVVFFKDALLADIKPETPKILVYVVKGVSGAAIFGFSMNLLRHVVTFAPARMILTSVKRAQAQKKHGNELGS